MHVGLPRLEITIRTRSITLLLLNCLPFTMSFGRGEFVGKKVLYSNILVKVHTCLQCAPKLRLSALPCGQAAADVLGH